MARVLAQRARPCDPWSRGNTRERGAHGCHGIAALTELEREPSDEEATGHLRRIRESGEKLLKEAGVPYATEILRGPIASTIAERADALGCDGIVMGTRGMTALKNLVLGSVATKVVHASQLPVTLVK